MSYKVRITNQADSGDGISVEARVNGEPVAHTFPKGMGFFREPEDGKPPFVEKLEEKYEEKMKRQGKTAQTDLTGEERKVHANEFVNKTYGEESFKQEDNQNRTMDDVDFSNPEEIRGYLKENMAEGYLSKSEEEHIDQFVNNYTELMENEGGSSSEDVQELVRKVFESKVQ